jgi:hypothetical protein
MDPGFGNSQRGMRNHHPDVLPTSQYLQERLQERRARSTRPKRGRQSDFGPSTAIDDDIFLTEARESRPSVSRAFDSSPFGLAPHRESEVVASSMRKRAPGVKDVNEQMDRLVKANFDLKLELDQRREHTAKLQQKIDGMKAQVERAEQLEHEHTELLRINSQLVEELEKRDKAVEEAMDIICELEDKVADVMERSSATRPSTANADSGYAGTETHEQVPPSSPPEVTRQAKTPHATQRAPPPAASAAANKLLSAINTETPARPRREPHILSQKKPSTNALRSVYLENAQTLHSVQSFNSLLTKRESKIEDDEAMLNSPRLSVLSESSFPSLYSPKEQLSPDGFAWEGGVENQDDPGPSVHLRQDSIKRVSQWMEDRDEMDETPSKTNRAASPLAQMAEADAASASTRRPVDTSQFNSLAKTLSNGSSESTEMSSPPPTGVTYVKPFPIRTSRPVLKTTARPTSFAGPMFGEPLLPPTPDSASTRMLRNSRSSIVDEERSLLDSTPVAVRGFDPLEPGVRTAPRQFRSSLELNTAHQSFVQRQNDQVYESIEHDDDNVLDHLDYDDFPDGSSLLMGTPSRFFKNERSPVPPGATSQRDFAASTSRQNTPRRRQSSSEVASGPRKPSMTRAETSPMVVPTQERVVIDPRQSFAASVTSPRSQHSGSSAHTVVQSIEQSRALSPDFSRTRSEAHFSRSVASPPRSRTSPSPARTLSQKTQSLWSRMSNSAQRDTNSHSEQREKSPLPTLTSTPSSAYIDDIPKDAAIRRPGTSQGYHQSDSSSQAMLRPHSSRDRNRPSLPGRTSTAPSTERRPSSNSDKERPNFFKRRGSVKTVDAGPPPSMSTFMAPTVASSAAQHMTEGGGKTGLARRRGSIREAVGAAAAKRPWR